MSLLKLSLNKMTSIRWVFDLSKWQPSEKELLLATSCIQNEDKARIERFFFQKDAKATLAGRLLMRKFIYEYSGFPYSNINITRDSNNKPIWKAPNGFPKLSFNVSHQGSYAVLAGEIGDKKVGVDVMKFEYTGGKELTEFFRLMKSQFSNSEWKNILGLSGTTEDVQTKNFYRHWTLKESYVKAIGIGITIDLKTLDFRIHSELNESKVITDTILYQNDVKKDWLFEESLIDPLHCVAVALERESYNFDLNSNNSFKRISADSLLKDALPVLKADYNYCKAFLLKPESPQSSKKTQP